MVLVAREHGAWRQKPGTIGFTPVEQAQAPAAAKVAAAVASAGAAVAATAGAAAGASARRASGLALGAARPAPAPDAGKTWGDPSWTRPLNFGHRPDAAGALYKVDAAGVPVWAANGKAITPDQWAAMPASQQAAIAALAPEADRAALRARLAGGDAARATTTPPPAPAPDAPLGAEARDQMAALLRAAQAGSQGKRPDGWCYTHVWSYIQQVGYGKFPGVGIPDSHAAEARQFAELVNQDPARYGLRRLAIDDPYDAPAGAIVVVAAGTPGTSHATAGDIAIADGRGGFYNGGEMGYGGRGSFPPGNDHVLGVYVPA